MLILKPRVPGSLVLIYIFICLRDSNRLCTGKCLRNYIVYEKGKPLRLFASHYCSTKQKQNKLMLLSSGMIQEAGVAFPQDVKGAGNTPVLYFRINLCYHL